MYLSLACLQLQILCFISSAFAIPLTAVSDVGFQTRSLEPAPASLIQVTFPHKANSKLQNAAHVCDHIKQALIYATSFLPELKGLGVSCGNQYYQPSRLRPIPFTFTVPVSKQVTFCDPVCTGMLLRTGSISISGRETIYEGKKLTQMITIGDSHSDLGAPSSTASSEDVPASKSGTHLKVDVAYAGTDEMTQKEMREKVEKLFDYVPHGLAGMNMPLTFTFGKYINPGPPLASSVSSVGIMRPPSTIYFKFTSSPAIDFCRPDCNGRLWVGDGSAFILGPRATQRTTSGELKIQRVIKISPVR
ncbi:hypothetical protein F5050DRAFT_1710202 [Lentinula boryana]|uniref:Uncharacterized protein n=1 Tax=Lentinula boryana TaxID=40481 RepID=A0ABQ8QJQ2_9AGAR|nr:hypothetical protein F5050DRAFT_1710202 [Lentinula boryana]